MRMILHAPNRILYFSVSNNVICMLGRLGHSEEMEKKKKSEARGLVYNVD